ncbi:PAS domain-containing sensor histidine kinase [Tianweitania sediminis]|uniref:Blue-light-activated histidine kinase n=1 Tax=Tianweitania sediminis TaxID=1502156 RepID=A0A8J7R027_9HYPH|nr:PAS domain-containing protein [Tianweitania sediminis]MBP0437401.1 PAS domain-containing protein [Tianweitania sediminis]
METPTTAPHLEGKQPLPRHSMMRDVIQRFDWMGTSLGPLADWPGPIAVCLRLMLASSRPMAMLLGEQGVLLFNDGYAEFAGPRHTDLIGKPVADAWPEVADFNRSNVDRLMQGETFRFHNLELSLDRTGSLETFWFDLDYIPILDAQDRPLGGLALVTDVTEQVIAARGLKQSQEKLSFALDAAGIVGTWDWDIERDIVVADRHFAGLYGVDPAEAASGTPIGKFLTGVHPADQPHLQQKIEQAIAQLDVFRTEYRVRDRDGGERWVLAVGRAFPGADGKAQRLPGLTVDITERKAIETALADSEARFRAIADTMPQMVWSTLPDGYHDYYNARWYEFTGVPVGSTDGPAWNGMFHPEDQERAWATWRDSLETGEIYEIEYRLRHHSGQYRWTLGRALPVRDTSGEIVRWFGTCTDIHESKLAAVEREVVAQELSHRIKNIFSVLTGLVSLSGRQYPELAPVVGELRQRIAALGRAHDFVRPHSDLSRPIAVDTTIHALIRELLSPFAEEGQRLFFRGQDIRIDDRAATPLALLFHELATNAAKYGALSNETGRVEVESAIVNDTLELVWRESGGPRGSGRHPEDGFGSKLIKLSAEAQMGGSVSRRFTDQGLVLNLSLPIQSLTRTAQHA